MSDKLKSAEEYLKEKYYSEADPECPYQDIKEMIEEAQSDAYNQGIKDAAASFSTYSHIKERLIKILSNPDLTKSLLEEIQKPDSTIEKSIWYTLRDSETDKALDQLPHNDIK